MSEQSFNYLASSILEYLNKTNPAPGDRFHVQFEKEEDVADLYAAFDRQASDTFNYGDEYKTVLSDVNSTKLVVAGTHHATENFLTNLRNRTADQQGNFAGKALLIIHNTDLDSIIGGAESLSKESRPLHAESLRERLRLNIDQSTLQKHEKLALTGVLSGMQSSLYEDVASVFSYFPFMSILAKGTTVSEDWNNLGLFPDKELATCNTPKEINKRIHDNSEWFEAVHTINRYSSNIAEELEQHFSSAGVSELKSDNWMETGYGKVARWHDEKTSKSLPKYAGLEESLFGGLAFWDRHEGESAAASRKRHIIVFNPELHDQIEFSINFSESVRQSAIKLPKNTQFGVQSKGRQLTISCSACSHEGKIGQFTYEEPEASGKYIFNIAVLPVSEEVFNAHKSTYKVSGGARSQRLQLYYDGPLLFNDHLNGENRDELKADQTFSISMESKTVLLLDENEDEERLPFNLRIGDCNIPCEVYQDTVKPTRISGVRIWKWKREQKKSFEYPSENKLIFGNDEYFTNRLRTKYFLDLEAQLIESHATDCFWVNDKSGLTPKHLKLSQPLLDAFRDLKEYYKRQKRLPSLTYMAEDLMELQEKVVSLYLQELTSIDDEIQLSEEKRNLLYLGAIEHHDGEQQIYLSPLHPLNLAYQLEFAKQTQDKKVPEEILKCLSPALLLPYINDPRDSKIKLQPVPETELPEWIVYKPCNTLNRGWHNEYVQKLISEKIEEYTQHFPYLFTGSAKAPVRINLMHMGDCTDALKGLVYHFKRALEKANGDARMINPLRLCIYGDHGHCNKFEDFARYSDPEMIRSHFEIDLEIPKLKNLDASDVLAVLQNKMKFYLKDLNSSPDYAHVTFYRFDQGSIEWTYQKMKNVKTGISLGGVVSAVPSVFRADEYLTGFGEKDIPQTSSQLIQMSESINALARVADTHDPYSTNEATFSALKESQKTQLDSVYNSSNWVTFIDPKVDLNFFKMHETAKDLVIIHYSDQYNNSSGYDAITVTRKSHQYQAILREFLHKHDLTPTLEHEMQLINMFNAINGDWLLQLIAGKKHFPREKISILSAVKTMLAILQHPEITWVPLSLEEVLRVSGGVGLKQTEGLFSAKNLGEKGAHCDDLLMAGVERRDGKVVVHLFPVEVKIGNNAANVIEKAKVQGLRTAKTLRAFLDSNKQDFTSAFYRNFFAKLILTGAEKMELYKILPESNWSLITDTCRGDLLNDAYEVSWMLEDKIGKAGVLSFQSENYMRSMTRTDDVLLINLLGSDGHVNLLKSVPELIDLYTDADSSIDEKLLLCNAQVAIPKERESDTEPETERKPSEEPKDAPSPSSPIVPHEEVEHDGMQILFGHDVNDKQPIHWFPNDTDKVMHTNTGIIGTMGTGKTQFTKSMVTQLVRESKNNVNGTQLGFLIFDYKGDYIKDDFIEATGARRFDLHHLPYNPLALTVTDNAQPMLPLHTANAIKESISKAFNLGTVQQQRLRDVIMEAYDAAGINKALRNTWGLPAPTLSDVCNVYLNSEDVKSDSLYAALDNLYQFEIFEPDSSKTTSLFDLLNGVVVVNLSGYDQSIQNLVVAITLDQFYSQMQKAGHSTIQGNLREIQKMILVDEADNFLSQDFTALRKILKEGREFGVGTILSTQFLNHFSTGDNEYSNYILSWIVHRVSEINPKEVGALFGLQDKASVMQMVSNIKGLKKHLSVVNVGHGNPIFIKDKAFWELKDE